jgi:hypothetical protein
VTGDHLSSEAGRGIHWEAAIYQDQTLDASGKLRRQPDGNKASHRHATDVDGVDLQLVQDHDHAIDMLSERERPGDRHTVAAAA